MIALGLAQAHPALEVTAIELQPRLAALARRNAEENALAARVRVVEADLADVRAMRAAAPGACAEVVLSNPPYQPLGEGPPSPAGEEAIAKHEARVTIAEVARQAGRLLVPGGRAALVFPSDRLVALLSALAAAGLTPSRLRFVHPRADAPAGRVLVEARKGGRGRLTVEPPLVVRDGDRYAPEVARALGEEG